MVPAFKTTCDASNARAHIITRNDSPDISFDRSINPYRGCEHGCVYCFARPTHAYLGLSPGLDFETQAVRQGRMRAELLERELAAPGYQPKTIAIGTNTDPYQPIERQHRIMRASSKFWRAPAIRSASSPNRRWCCAISISSRRMAEKGLVKVALSVTTLDPVLARAHGAARRDARERRLERSCGNWPRPAFRRP